MRLHLERHIRKEYGGREDLSPRERAKLTRRLSRTLHSSGQSPGVSSRRSGLSERERLPDQVNYERLLERASARRLARNGPTAVDPLRHRLARTPRATAPI